ncbi:oxidoreductase [Novosphingobium cyanobacteriorum]|uniref:Oxidoreductase n=1 Tax=Novosphingobium cyanobacteriorum TaxID=3024215 RepID=A0ABT6CIT5_9SPHN|nr:oxidoreductase [Novosphingobium cyanobacteriorum]MDF8333838.1 oxidoreductase [Novosphingobium cyanobacteriorum]
MTIGVALVGYGFAGRTFHAPLIGAEPALALRVVVSSQPDKVLADLPEVVVLPDLASALARGDIDLVVIATPNDSHVPLARAAIAAGKHVVVDKPIAPTFAEAQALAAQAKAAGVNLSVFHNRRWDSDFLSVKAAIEGGAVGTVAHFESHFDRFRPTVRDRWRENAGPASGVWFDLGPHLVDQALMLFGRPERIMASMAQQRPWAEATDWAHVVLEYAQLRVVLHAGMLVAGGAPRFVVHGSGGSLVKQGMDRQEAQLVSGMRPGAPGWGLDDDAPALHTPDSVQAVQSCPGDQREFYRQLTLALKGMESDSVTIQQSLAVAEIVELAEKAAITGSAQRL